MNAYRTGLPPVPRRMRALPVDARGYPIPWFVADMDGVRDFRVADAHKRAQSILSKLCWVCGQQLATLRHFVVGPMCAITRTTSEPPLHIECAEFSVRACPFMLLPRAKRRRDANMAATNAPGIALDRNPGVSALYTCRHFATFRTDGMDGVGAGWLIEMGEPMSIDWYAEGRTATRAQIVESIDDGMPYLRELAERDGGSAPLDVDCAYERLLYQWVPYDATAAG